MSCDTALNEPRRQLYSLLGRALDTEAKIEDFCSEFEAVFNFDLEKTSVTDLEWEIFEAVFEAIIWYSPFPEERAAIPNYKGPGEILKVVNEARSVLNIAPYSEKAGAREQE